MQHKFRRQRGSFEYRYYLNGRRQIMDAVLGFTEPARPEAVLPGIHLPPPSPQMTALSEKTRKELVCLLMATDSRYTDRRLISHFTKEKLARMLLDARSRAGQAKPAQETRTA